MKRHGLLPVLGLLLLGAQCDRTTRPAAPPPGWVIPLVAPDSSGSFLVPTDVLFEAQGMVLMGFLTDTLHSVTGNFLGRLTYTGTWQEFHPLSQGLFWLFARDQRVMGLPWTGGFPCSIVFFNPDGTIQEVLTVTHPEGYRYTCWVMDATPWGNGYLVSGLFGTTPDLDTTWIFLAYLERGGGGFRQVWFQRHRRGNNAWNVGGMLFPGPEGTGLLGMTAADPFGGGGDSLWLLKFSPSGAVVAETTMGEPWGFQTTRRKDTLILLTWTWEDNSRNLLAFGFRDFRVLWHRESVPYLVVDVPPTGSLMGALTRDSARMRYAQIALATGAEVSFQDLWDNAPEPKALHTGPRGFVVTFPGPGYDTTYLAYVPYGGALPSLPGRTAVAADLSPCAPRHLSLQPHRTLWRTIFEVYGSAPNHTTGNGREVRCSGISGN